MFRLKFSFIALLALVVYCASAAGAAVEQGDDIVVTAKKNSGEVLVDVHFSVPATPRETWAVLTDFEHMAQFVSNLESSKVIKKFDNKVQISQSGKTSHGAFSFSFEAIREIDLWPYDTIRSHMISGTMKKSDGITRLVAEQNGTSISFHSESISGIWVPPGIGTSFIEDEVRSQFQDMRKEILRRKGITHPAGAG
jgi:carbon monoxide dehydrogenase subunit G